MKATQGEDLLIRQMMRLCRIGSHATTLPGAVGIQASVLALVSAGLLHLSGKVGAHRDFLVTVDQDGVNEFLALTETGRSILGVVNLAEQIPSIKAALRKEGFGADVEPAWGTAEDLPPAGGGA